MGDIKGIEQLRNLITTIGEGSYKNDRLDNQKEESIFLEEARKLVEAGECTEDEVQEVLRDSRSAREEATALDFVKADYFAAKQAAQEKGKIFNYTKFFNKAKKGLDKESQEQLKEYITSDLRKDVLDLFKDSDAKARQKVWNEINGAKSGHFDPRHDELARTVINECYKLDADKTVVRRNIANERYEELKSMPEKELNKTLGKNIMAKLEDSNYLAEHAGSAAGEFDMTPIADIVFERVGKEFVADAHEDSNMSERYLIKQDLKDKLGLELTDKEVQTIVEKLVKVPYRGVGFFDKKTTPIHVVEGGGLGALGGASYAHAAVITNGIVEAEATAAAVLWPVTIPAGIAAALLVDYLCRYYTTQPKNEKDCPVITDLNNSSNLSLADVKKKYPAVADYVIKELIEPYAIVEDGIFKGWDESKSDELKAKLDEIRGKDSPANCKEVLGAAIDNTKPAAKPQPAEENEAIVKKEVPQHTEESQVEYDNTYVHNRKYGDTWKGIVEAYFPEMVAKHGLWGKNGAIKMLQRALCTDENGKFDAETFRKLIQATNLPEKILVPSRIGEFERQINPVKPVEIQTKADAPVAGLKKVGHEEKGVRITTEIVGGKPVYTARDAADSSQQAKGATRAEAVDGLEAKTGKKYEKVTEE